MTVRVSPEEYELLQQAKGQLQKKGIVGTGLDDAEIDDLEFDWEDFAMGAIVGIGAYLLFKSLTEEK